ncbi:MAG: AzlC family ABC transporter permease [Kofleriaceae bacterium]|nr:AzlC family ABC transporter permease [Kofleriaceae bacterium]
MSKGNNFRLGIILGSPFALSMVPFAIVTAIAAQNAKMSAFETLGASTIVFAGAAQLTAMELSQHGTPMMLVFGAAVLVNLRFLMYSAALSPKVRDEALTTRSLVAYLLTDAAFGVTTAQSRKDSSTRTAWFFIGAGTAIWLAWQVGTVLGLTLASNMPTNLSLEFSVGLAFVAMVVPHIRDWPTTTAAAVSIGVFLLGRDLPYSTALLPAAAAGLCAGLLCERCTQ